MTRSRLIQEYLFLFFLIMIFLAVPYYFANKRLNEIESAVQQIKYEREMRILQQKEIDRLSAQQQEISRQVQCLAVNVYHEARGEGDRGMRAVAQVTINRTRSENFPQDICDVVYQKKPNGRCQFSWYCDGKPDVVKDREAWVESIHVAQQAIQGKTVEKDTKNALYYHSKRVKPRWSYKKRFLVVIGRHIFYSERV